MITYVGRFIFSILFGAPSIFLFWATWQAIKQRQRWLSLGVIIEGEIVALKERTRAKSTVAGRIPLAPVVAYRAPAGTGEMKRFTSQEAASPSPYAIGQRVQVRYIAGDPREAELNAVVEGWSMIAAVATLALACLAAALVPIIITVGEFR